MKKHNLLIYLLFLSLFSIAEAQNKNHKLPDVKLKTTDGQNINTSQISNNGRPIIIVFWKTCCKSPEIQLDAMEEVYKKWVNETGVKIIAVSIDDSRTTDKVKPYVKGKGWDFEILLDLNSDFKRAMNVNAVPHTFLLNARGEIVWQMVLFNEGDENIIYEQLKKLLE